MLRLGVGRGGTATEVYYEGRVAPVQDGSTVYIKIELRFGLYIGDKLCAPAREK